MKKLNNELKLGECQDGRIWLHSNTLGYGKWITTVHLVSIIKRLRFNNKPPENWEIRIPIIKREI